MTTYRLGIDIGGTFTDLVLMDGDTGELETLKTPSVGSDPAEGIAEGIRQLAERHRLDPAAVTYFAHGQTFALNTVLQRNGARTGLLVTRGFRDLLSIGRLRLREPINFFTERPASLVDPGDVREVDERVLVDGSVERALDLDEVERLAAALVASGVEALAVCFLHAYAHPAHEHAAVARLRVRFPDVYVSASSEVWPERREFERCTATVLNAYIGAAMAAYFARLADKAGTLGVPATLRITKSNGGIMTVASAAQAPVETLLSGPASGVTGAAAVAAQAGIDRFIALDMGGTSVDVSIVDRGLSYSSESMLGEMPVIIPAVEIFSIGAGGGSIAWVDPSGVLKVGPRSAGSMPGPACYGHGGTRPTVTDAYVAVGLVDPDHFLGGRLKLDRDAAIAALGALGDDLGLDPVATASAIIDVTTVKMYAQLMPVLARRGVDPSEFALVAYGGAGPTHAALLAQEAGISRLLVPWSPGTLCGLGALITDLRQDFVRTVAIEAGRLADDVLQGLYAGMEADARAWLDAQGEEVEQVRVERTADVQFKGQSFTIPVALGEVAGRAPTVGAIRAGFTDAYEDAYGIRDLETEIEIHNLRLSIVGVMPKPRHSPPAAATDAPRPAQRTVVEHGRTLAAEVRERAWLRPGDVLRGPAVVEAPDTTVFLPSGVAAVVDAKHNLVATVGGPRAR